MDLQIDLDWVVFLIPFHLVTIIRSKFQLMGRDGTWPKEETFQFWNWSGSTGGSRIFPPTTFFNVAGSSGKPAVTSPIGFANWRSFLKPQVQHFDECGSDGLTFHYTASVGPQTQSQLVDAPSLKTTGKLHGRHNKFTFQPESIHFSMKLTKGASTQRRSHILRHLFFSKQQGRHQTAWKSNG